MASVLPIRSPAEKPPAFALFELGFRPFFLGAAVFGLLSVLVWAGAYVYGWPLPSRLPVAAMAWHGHERVFGYAAAVLGFLLKAFAAVSGQPPYLAVHAFAAGAIGMMTVGMMARVSLGHMGRSIQMPPVALPGVFGLLVAAFLVRVVLPLAFPGLYPLWIGLAQVLWVAAFAGFLALRAHAGQTADRWPAGLILRGAVSPRAAKSSMRWMDTTARCRTASSMCTSPSP